MDIFIGINTIFDNYKSFNCNVIDEQGNALEGVTVTCNYRIEKTTNVFTELTDVDGILPEQLIRFVIAPLEGPGGYTTAIANPDPSRNIEYFIRKPGYKTKRGRKYIGDRDDPILLKDIVLKKNRFRE